VQKMGQVKTGGDDRPIDEVSIIKAYIVEKEI